MITRGEIHYHATTRSASHGRSCAHNTANNEHGRLEIEHGGYQVIVLEWVDLRVIPLKLLRLVTMGAYISFDQSPLPVHMPPFSSTG